MIGTGKYCDCSLKQFEAGRPAVFVAYRAVIEFGPLFARFGWSVCPRNSELGAFVTASKSAHYVFAWLWYNQLSGSDYVLTDYCPFERL